MHRSASLHARLARSNSASGSSSFQSRRLSLSTPPHPGCSQNLPVAWNEIPPTSKSRRYSFPHTSQVSRKRFPCSSARFSRGSPDRMWRPSTFWLTTSPTPPISTSLTSAMCVRVGCTMSNDFDAGGATPLFSAVHTPCGPRKSETPALVEMPAPVRITHRLEFLTRSASRKILYAVRPSLSRISSAPSPPPFSERFDNLLA
mmetsp:Transcript_58058/g.136933  ORF Transcript_58058/g.136933 Transcript_58058/m.136933 type:complete len:202 (-) Transcript_58058:61-666(-)